MARLIRVGKQTRAQHLSLQFERRPVPRAGLHFLGVVVTIRFFLRSCALLAWFVLVVNSALCQVPNGSVNGRVVDPKGALILGAKISAVSQAQGALHTTVTNSSGLYSLADLPVGGYDVTIEAPGFAVQEVKSVQVEAGRASTVDVTLGIAAAGTTVKVDALAARVDQTQSMIQGEITSEAIGSIPLNGRNFLELAYLIPGNRPAPHVRSYEDQYAGGELGGQFWPRRQHYGGRRRQQRRSGGRHALKFSRRFGAGVSDCHRPVYVGGGPFRQQHCERGDEVGDESASWIAIPV